MRRLAGEPGQDLLESRALPREAQVRPGVGLPLAGCPWFSDLRHVNGGRASPERQRHKPWNVLVQEKPDRIYLEGAGACWPNRRSSLARLTAGGQGASNHWR